MTSTARSSRAPARRPVARGAARPKESGWQQANNLFWEFMPFSAEAIEKALTILTIMAIVGGLAVAAVVAGIPKAVGTELGHMAGRAGFKVKRIDVKGLKRMNSFTVYTVALNQRSTAMPLVDVDQVRRQLMQHSWIEDARISRRWPDTLVVDIVERKPAAVWQFNKRLMLIDRTGVALERVDPRAIPDVLLIIGPKANAQAQTLFQLLDIAPGVRPRLADASWVGNRRWDFRFTTGEVLALPEGDANAATALAHFARIEARDRLLGRGFVRFDMRDPTKLVVRLQRAPDKADTPPKAAPEETADDAPEDAPEKPASGDASKPTKSAKSNKPPVDAKQ